MKIMTRTTATRLRFTLTAFAAACLAGCASMAPPYERPAAPVAPAFPLAEAEGAAAPPLAWQKFFTDAKLRSLIERALQHNRDLRIAVLNIETARAQFGIREADRLPNVGAGVTTARQPGPTGQPQRTYTAGLTLAAFELDLFGRLRSLSDAALAQFLATQEARKAAQISLVSTVATLYYALAADEALLDVTRRTLASREESLRLMQLRFENGASSEIDVRQAQSQVEAARVAAAAQQRQRALDRNALTLLVGQPLESAAIEPSRLDAGAVPDAPPGLPSDVLLQRPDVRQAEQELIAANANIGAARAAFYPNISLTGSIGTASTELSGLFSNTVWTFTGQLLQPIFDAGRNRANLQLSQAQRDIAVAQYERAIQSAFRDVADALAGRAYIGEQLRAQLAQAQAEQARFALSELRFKNGVSSSLELLDAQRTLFASEQAVVEAQVALVQNRIAVYRALGGGWSEPPQTVGRLTP
jgi:NodT family efflux transporter outer membrane factor (OMF) lipoprotein